MKRELIVNTGGQDRTVVVEGPLDNGMFQIMIDGASREVDAKLIRPGTWSIEIAGRNYLVDLDKRPALQGKVAASVGASEAVLSVEDAAHRRLAAAAAPRGQARGEQLRAPIAGKVVKVLVAIGDTVAPGHAVIVLEAMKMENELVSERGGTVKAVHKQAGQAVDTGDLLVELE
jgi:glutaconyl-CoA/methylmalonyl-CoA decarboxylase subunit gamma